MVLSKGFIWSLYTLWREIGVGVRCRTIANRLTMAEMIRTTLTVSPQPDGGVPLFSRTKRHAARIPSSSWNRENTGRVERTSQFLPLSLFTKHWGITLHTYLPIVPCPHSNLILCAVVDPSDVVQDILLPLLFRIHEHCVIWERIKCGTTFPLFFFIPILWDFFGATTNVASAACPCLFVLKPI